MGKSVNPRFVEHRMFRFNLDGARVGESTDSELYTCHKLESSKRLVELYVSPSGKSQRVFVDGVEIK